jgi:hypothetical protein
MTTTLTRDELETTASVIKCSTTDIKAAAPVRLYKSMMGRWNYTGHYGVAAVLVEPMISTVMIHVVDLSLKSLVLSQECYPNFEYVILAPYMHAFEGDTTLYGLSFAENFDSTAFSTTVKGLVTLCNLPQQQPHAQIIQMHQQQPIMVQQQPIHVANHVVQPAMQFQQQQQQQFVSPAAVPQERKRHSFNFGSKIKNLFHRKPKEKRRPTISGASNFQHTAHLGFNMQSFGDLPTEWKNIFEKAGISEEQMKDKKTAKLITKTINNMNQERMNQSDLSGSYTNVQNQVPLQQQLPPQVPTTASYVPPLIPTKQQEQQLPTQMPVPSFNTPSPPVPPPLVAQKPNLVASEMKVEGTSRPPNPPPPPASDIQQTTTTTTKPALQARPVDFLSEIQKGKQLKPISVADMTEKEQDSFAEKLRHAMEQRRPVIGEDDDSSDDESSDEEW